MFASAILALAAACNDGGTPATGDTPTIGAPSTPPARATPADTAGDLAARIDVRADLPESDPIDLAARYGLTPGRAPATVPFAGERAVGERRDFRLLDLPAGAFNGTKPPSVRTITATLHAKSQHAYFYIDDALGADRPEVERSAALFEDGVWPTVTGAFGLPPAAGIDGDPRMIVLQADLGGSVGGYFSSDDRYVRAARPFSNEADMIYLDRTVSPGGAAFNVVLAHEFQHLIHREADASEEAWTNEGLSEVASLLVGGAGSSIDAFSNRPEVQLNEWSSKDANAHYGAGSAFYRYLSSRFGGDASLGAIVRSPGDGAAGVDEFLAGRGETLRFAGAFADWIVANVLDLESGPYGNPARAVGVTADKELTANTPVDGTASQFGTDYYSIAAGGAYLLRFRGAANVPVLSADDPGSAFFWGNSGDAIDTTLTREIDLAEATAPSLTFRLWHDIERWFDWGYVAVSDDGGATWKALAGRQTSADDPVHVALGPGYTGKSGGDDEPAWVDERIDLAAYAGRKVLLRFEYVTDGAAHGEGMAIDDIAIEGIAFSDADASDAGWRSDGWVRIDRPLRQTYAVRLIATRAGGPDVIDVPLDAANSGELAIDAGAYVDLTLAIAGTTEGTRNPAPYRLELVRR